MFFFNNPANNRPNPKSEILNHVKTVASVFERNAEENGSTDAYSLLMFMVIGFSENDKDFSILCKDMNELYLAIKHDILKKKLITTNRFSNEEQNDIDYQEKLNGVVRFIREFKDNEIGFIQQFRVLEHINISKVHAYQYLNSLNLIKSITNDFYKLNKAQQTEKQRKIIKSVIESISPDKMPTQRKTGQSGLKKIVWDKICLNRDLSTYFPNKDTFNNRWREIQTNVKSNVKIN